MRLAHAGHQLPELFRRGTEVLQQAVPFDAGCWHTLDPATLLETSHDVVNLPFENPRASELEYLYDDFNQFATLARSARRSGILSTATEGVLERSRRYRELIHPFGLHAELRAAFVSAGAAWGAVGLLRAAGSADFTAAEAAFLHEVSSYLGHAVRSALLRESAEHDPSDAAAPGVVLLDHRSRLEAITPSAERLLDELVPGKARAHHELPYVVYAVAARARVAGRAAGEDRLAHARVPSRTGPWLALHGSLASEKAAGRVAVIIERAKPAAVAPLIVQAHGLSPREAQVLQALLRGASTKAIAGLLGISPYTVQEHCTKLCEKFGVRTRRELAARVFFAHYGARTNRR